MELTEKFAAYGAWLNARLQRAKRIPPFSRIWHKEPAEAKVLSPEEAAKERARHQALVERLAPDAPSLESVMEPSS